MSLRSLLTGRARFIVGLTLKKAIELGFDYGLYPLALIMFGYVWGGIIMTIMAVILNIAIIKMYDWAKTDWLYIEALKSIRDDDTIELTGVLRVFRPLMKRGDIPAFFVLCLDDPVTACLYLRKGSNCYNGFTRRDWYIFAAANIVSNFYWILGLAAVIESFTAIFS